MTQYNKSAQTSEKYWLIFNQCIIRKTRLKKIITYIGEKALNSYKNRGENVATVAHIEIVTIRIEGNP